MNRDASAAAGTTGTRCTCTACPLLCDDISLTPAGADRACDLGRAAFAAALPSLAADDASPAASKPADAWENGRPLSRDAAVARAAATLGTGRCVLVTGLVDATLEAIVAACDLAETLDAAIDAGHPDVAAVAGPTIARAGAVTADWEELRDRADLVIFWCVDPGASHPRFIERFVAPPLEGGRPRRTIAVGAVPVIPVATHHQHLPLGDGRSVELARCLHLACTGSDLHAGVEASLVTACNALVAAIRSATCVAFVTSSGGPVGLEAWSIAHLVRAIAHRTPAFQVPLVAAGTDAAGAAAVCTWRYGAAGAISRADRAGGRFLPGEATAARLVARGEVDVILAVGRLGSDVEQAIAAAGPSLAVVRIAGAPADRGPVMGRSIELRCADTLLTAGTMLRGDGRSVAVAPPHTSPLPSLRDLLVMVHQAVAKAPPPAAGGHP